MSTLNLSPKNLLILGAVAVGAYWFMTRKQGSSAGKSSPQYYGSYSRKPQGAPGSAQSVTNAGIGLLSGLLGVGQPTYRPPGYQPGYFPDTVGEADARRMVPMPASVPDMYSVNPPASYMPDVQDYLSSGGYMESAA